MGFFSKSKTPKIPAPKPINDQFLREYGFRIHSRPRHGSVVWYRNGREYPEQQAVKLALEERRRSLEALEAK